MTERTTRDCVSCGAAYSCVWEIDAWVCRRERCRAEFYPHDDVDDAYAAPSTGTPENPDALKAAALVLPIFDWASRDRDSVGLYIVVNTPGSPGMYLWNGHRWIDLDLPESTATPR